MTVWDRVENMADASGPTIADHQLLRCIGRGSYGEVWLARSLTGAYRAIKVVHRRTFDHERPYLREFEGIQKFERVSHEHQSEMAVLHVGRNDAEGYFYYIMELADDEGGGPEVDPDTYSPRTLRSEMRRRGRLPVAECVEIAISLAVALDHLHRNGLIHRDIKPGNIIFVSGVPKLADIGLVTDMGATRTFVGTDGYVPPEGPRSAQGDLFSLGMVLYEMSTGKDRFDYPELPTALMEFPDAKELIALNEVILRACEPDPALRYQSAFEMDADLLLVQAGDPPGWRESAEAPAPARGFWKTLTSPIPLLTFGFGAARSGWVGRVNSYLFTALLLGLLVLLGWVFVWFLQFQQRETREASAPRTAPSRADRKAPNRLEARPETAATAPTAAPPVPEVISSPEPTSAPPRRAEAPQGPGPRPIYTPSDFSRIGLVAWWCCDGNPRDPVARQDGILSAGADYVSTGSGRALRLNGSTGCMSVPSSPAWPSGTNNFTIALWAKFSSAPGSAAFVAADDGGGWHSKWIFWWNDSMLRFHVVNPTLQPSANLGDGRFFPVMGRWYHLAVTREGYLFRFYNNGSLLSTKLSTIPIPRPRAPLTVGQAEGSFFFNGQLADIRIYRRALAAADLQGLINGEDVREHAVTGAGAARPR
jgi:hypothetical protein